MIPIDHLRDVSTIVVHRASALLPCADGRAGAYLAHRVLPHARIVEMTYNSRAHRMQEAHTGLLFADFSPHKSRVPDLLPCDPIVLDHHGTTKDIVRSFKHGVFADEKEEPGVSGAMLVYREVVWPMNEARPFLTDLTTAEVAGLRRIAELVGIRDTWQEDDSRFEEASNLSAFLSFVALDDLLAMRPAEVLRAGETMGLRVRAKTLADARTAVNNATHLHIGPHHVLLFSGNALSSDASMTAFPECVVVAYDCLHEGDEMRIQFSLRSRNGLDVGVLAKKMGGGGHGAAAGFSVSITPEWYRDPVSIVRGLFADVPSP